MREQGGERGWRQKGEREREKERGRDRERERSEKGRGKIFTFFVQILESKKKKI